MALLESGFNCLGVIRDGAVNLLLPGLCHGPRRCQSKRKHSGLTVSTLATDDAEVCQCEYGSLGIINLENADNGLRFRMRDARLVVKQTSAKTSYS